MILRPGIQSLLQDRQAGRFDMVLPATDKETAPMNTPLTYDDLARCSDDELYALHDEVFIRLVRSAPGSFGRSIAMANLNTIKTVLLARASVQYADLPAATR
ncbi:hypothetical protein [Ochrobactrum sp. MC-1LL]|nr:hypothetical protein [Ochrobactrum sp. MC-1LL]NKE76508.1 hypothetical protein [Ochrobactrum sp. MC-1LL]